MNNYKVYQHIFPNGKSYIGITSQKLTDRWRRGKGYSETTYVYKAIQKYGWDNIEHKVLYENLTKEQAEAKERELIQQFNTMNPEYGYNLTRGGEGKLQYDYEQIISLWESGLTMVQISDVCGISVSRLNRFLDERGYSRQQNKAKQLERKVNQYDLDGHYLYTHDSLKKAAEAIGIMSNAGICQCCQEKMRQTHGYQWKYYGGSIEDIAPVQTRNEFMPGKQVEQYGVDGKLIATYNKIVEAAKAVNASTGAISAVLHGRNKTCKGYIWKFKSLDV